MNERIYTRCPACGNDTLTINKGHLLCTWHECKDPTLIDNLSTNPGQSLLDKPGESPTPGYTVEVAAQNRLEQIMELLEEKRKLLDELKLAKEKAEALDWLEDNFDRCAFGKGIEAEKRVWLFFSEEASGDVNGETLLSAINQARKSGHGASTWS